MRGFIHVLEIVIVALSVFAAISLFTNIPKIESDWSRTKLIMYGNDIMFSLDKQGISWFNKTQANHSIRTLLPKALEFDLMARNAIKPEISIGCVCTQGMTDVLRELLNDFEFNGANISFSLMRIDPSEISFPVTLDIMLFLNTNIPEEKRAELEGYLRADKGVMEISALDRNTLSHPIYQNLFNLEFISEASLGAYNAEFHQTGTGKPGNKIRKYFYHLPFRIPLTWGPGPGGVESCTVKYTSGQLTFRKQGYTLWVIDNTTTIPGSCDLALYTDTNNNNIIEPGEGPYAKGQAFSLNGYSFLLKDMGWTRLDIAFRETPEFIFRFSDLGEAVYPGDDSEGKILLKRSQEGRSVPVSALNYNIINGRGRVAWLSNSTIPEPVSGLGSDIKQLIKSLIAWAAGEEYFIVKGAEKTNPVTVYFCKVLSRDMFQPIELALTIGYK